MKTIFATLAALLCGAAQAYTLTLSCPDSGGTCTFTGPPITTTPPPTNPPANTAPTGCAASGGATYAQNATPAALSVSCASLGNPLGVPQWYSGGSPVANGGGLTYYPPTNTVGTATYYAVVANSVGSSTTNTVGVTVTPPSPTAGNCGQYGTIVDRGMLPHPANGVTTVTSNGEVSRFTVIESSDFRARTIKVAEFQAQKSLYTVGLSESPDCGPFLAGGGINTSTSITYLWANSVMFAGNPNVGQPGSTYAAVVPGQTYYLYIYYRDGLPGTRQTCDVDCNYILTVQ